MDYGQFLGRGVQVTTKERVIEGFLVSSIIEPSNRVHTITVIFAGDTFDFDVRDILSIEPLSSERENRLMALHELKIPPMIVGIGYDPQESELANCRCALVPNNTSARPDFHAARWEW